uniref:Cyclic nucleotide-binding protein n=1 Tax=Rhodopseudomonas palustris (strain BisA53) TaxID=316055 RepID=Q07L81_RHOP5
MENTRSFDITAFLQRFGDGKTVLKLAKNKIVYAQGDAAEAVYFIEKGRVKLNVVSKHGKEAVVAILEPGQFFGEGCLNGQTTRIATASTISDATIAAISRSAMIAALRNESQFSDYFMTWLLNRNIRIEEDLIDQLFNFSERRLARLLLLLAHFGKDGSPQPIDIEIDQGTLADMIGTTRSRVSFFMNKFRKLGFISYNGKIHVHNALLNAVLHDMPSTRNRSDVEA